MLTKKKNMVLGKTKSEGLMDRNKKVEYAREYNDERKGL